MTGPDEQPPPADGPAEVRAEALLLERAIGGWRGVIDSGLPTAVFVIAYVVTGGTLRTSLIAAIAAGVLIVGWRLIRREKLGQVAAGFAGLAISAWWASRNDNASDLYIPGMLTNLGYGTAFLVSIALLALAALCAGLVVKDKSPPSEAELAEQKPYIELALACLKEAIAAGNDNFDHMRQDPDLTPLHGLPDFEAMFPNGETK